MGCDIYRTPSSHFHHQNTLTKTPVRHFRITYEAETNTFMIETVHRNVFPLFSRPHISSKLRYSNICEFQNRGNYRVRTKKRVFLDVFENGLLLCLINHFHTLSTTCGSFSFIKKTRNKHQIDNNICISKIITCQSCSIMLKLRYFTMDTRRATNSRNKN